jgi:hypothetical protein
VSKEGVDHKLVGEEEKAIDDETLELLKEDARKCARSGRWILALAIGLGLALLGGAYWLTEVSVADLQKAEDPPLMLVLLLVRGTIFGGLSAGFLYGIFTIGNAYIDQSTRFRKRLYSAHMLNYAFETFSEEIKQGDRVKVDDLVRLFYAWNANVDSAFSRVAFQKASKNLVIGRSHLAVEDPPRADEQHSASVGVFALPIVGNTQAPGGGHDGSPQSS